VDEFEEKKPWYNDGDKVGGIMATVVMILLGVILGALTTKFAIWLITGEWTL
jgi:hypothetical protein